MTNPEIGQSIVANGIRTNYIEAGDASLPALVLIHGSGPGVTAFANWNGVIPALSEHFHVLAPDMVGFGYTEVPDDVSDFTLDFWVDHIVGFLDALGIERASFIGNSYGGALSLAVAARHPDRVRRFALMGAAGLRFEMSKGLLDVWGYEPSEANMRKLMETFAYNAGLVTDAIVLSRHNASIRPGSHEAFSRLFPEPRQAKLDRLATPEEDIRNIQAPALIIHGREDVIVPVDVAYRFSALLPHSELHVFGECGHWTQIEKKDRFVEVVLPFLKAV
ncbi:alpha/beta fold hydrolase [Sphingopyxis macrogoltabida]|uniref:2-hydroxy-6-oxo-2,4-heptadienoate hydrolase n=1 Tax=Sphingopyxis macrogoltabida TaxID=33050 RepID=A0AAC9AZE6_SPHMC|nr:alpha/beta fold hydrolase [Sphingopyxis macrogoltabida]ALJ16540.1 2-hydroxy-6-oxo-2,4-heptadienoate hydrolase [Sphingopyxis macrogoltabida]AMU92772.1 2-hydroxy-6-oxo-2,4-heptadienoate hydrolase [Sphingopyxis macrogoltabida]